MDSFQEEIKNRIGGTKLELEDLYRVHYLFSSLQQCQTGKKSKIQRKNNKKHTFL